MIHETQVDNFVDVYSRSEAATPIAHKTVIICKLEKTRYSIGA